MAHSFVPWYISKYHRIAIVCDTITVTWNPFLWNCASFSFSSLCPCDPQRDSGELFHSGGVLDSYKHSGQLQRDRHGSQRRSHLLVQRHFLLPQHLLWICIWGQRLRYHHSRTESSQLLHSPGNRCSNEDGKHLETDIHSWTWSRDIKMSPLSLSRTLLSRNSDCWTGDPVHDKRHMVACTRGGVLCHNFDIPQRSCQMSHHGHPLPVGMHHMWHQLQCVAGGLQHYWT